MNIFLRSKYALTMIGLALAFSGPVQGQDCTEGNSLQRKLCAAMLKMAKPVAPMPSTPAPQSVPSSPTIEVQSSGHAPQIAASGASQSGTFVMSGRDVVKSINDNVEAKQARSQSLDLVFSGFPGKAIDIFNVTLKPTEGRTNHITVKFSYRLSNKFISTFRAFMSNNACKTGDSTCQMQFCLENCVNVGPGPRDNRFEYPIIQLIDGGGVQLGQKYLGFALRFVDSSGNRVGNGWCADVFMMKSGEMDNLIRTREGLLTAGINRTISESADINVQELSPTVDLNKANGIRLTAFAYRGGSHIGGLFDIADQSKPIEIYIDRNKRVTTDGVISPKEKDNMCGWNGV